jgi:hypothetical protein
MGGKIYGDLLPKNPVINSLDDIVETREQNPHDYHPCACPRKGIFLFRARCSDFGFRIETPAIEEYQPEY